VDIHALLIQLKTQHNRTEHDQERLSGGMNGSRPWGIQQEENLHTGLPSPNAQSYSNSSGVIARFKGMIDFLCTSRGMAFRMSASSTPGICP
jgi:hypothetical protein